MNALAMPRVTLAEIKKGLNSCEKNGIPMSAVVLWADQVEEGDCYQTECGGVPGSVIMGVTYTINGEQEYGTLQFMPERISDIIN